MESLFSQNLISTFFQLDLYIMQLSEQQNNGTVLNDIEQVANTDYYTISYSYSKNRFYLTIRGFWKNPDVISNYVNDWRKAMLLAIPNFTLLTDATNAETYPPSVMTVHNEAQQVVIDAGLMQVAEVLPKSAFLKFQAELLSENSQMPCSKFNNIELAEEWLDSLRKENIV
ncbi:hypothetical protein WAF17_21755 [Bernardetia sp. ABR2-2B]|uniref:hypothetical protein n=1 Tax=Bernardetia sp. ABR2-2B TaxID=3127472 RepID=UPI0030D34DC5